MPSILDHLHVPLSVQVDAGLALLVLVVLAATALRLRRPWLANIQRKPLMTDNELEFFGRLQRALPAHWVFPQVAFSALLTDDGKLTPKKRFALRARFDRKTADFVICNRETLEIVALVELDDRTHEAKRDRRRDELTAAAGYQTLRYQSKAKPTEAEIAASIAKLTAGETPRRRFRLVKS